MEPAKSAVLAGVLVLAWLSFAEASHFQGGTISCGVQSGYTAKCDWKQGWRYQTGPCCYKCNPSMVGQYLSCSRGWWRCLSGCSGNLATITYTLTGVSTSENWEQGTHWFAHNFGGAGPFTVGYTGCCWRSLSYGYGGSWSVQVTFNLGSRSDTGKANTAPSTASAPIYRYQYGCGWTKTFIPMIDQDNDVIKCRWSTGSECAAVCNSLPSASLVSTATNCEVSMNTSGGNVKSGGWYAVAITLEDYPRSTISISGKSYSTGSPISVVPLQFMVYTPSMSVSCNAVPYWITPTPAAKTMHSVPRGTTLRLTFKAIDQSGHRVNSIIISGPGGVTQSSLQSSGNDRYITMAWTPASSHQGGYNLCFQASDGIGKVSEFRCITVAVAITCPDPGFSSTAGRQPSGSQTFNYGNAVTHTCNTGYVYASGSMTRTCQLNGAFDGSSPVCNQINCGAPSVGSGAYKASGSAYTHNKVTTFGCNTGYTRSSGSSSRTCQGGGTWSGSTYTCTRKSCGNPGTPSNGAKSGTNYLYNDQTTFTCTTGYLRSGSSSRTCQSSAVWSGTQPTCTKIRCQNPGSIGNSTRVMNPTSSSFEYNDKVTFNPHTGYEIKSGSQTRTCQASSQWSGSAPTIGRVNCPTPSSIRNSTRSGTDYRYLGKITYTCGTGYEIKSGNAQRTCQSNKQWSGSLPVCGRKVCGSPAINANMGRSGSDFAYTSRLIYTCNTGYEMTRQHQTTLTMTCQSNKQWSLAVPTCIKMLCSNPGLIQNSTRVMNPTSSSYEYLDKVTYNPHTGYEIKSGSQTRTCQSSRAWSGSQPTVGRINCPTAPYVRNSTRTGNDFRYLGVINYKCDIGYEVKNGNPTRTCGATKQWSGTTPYCGRKACGDPGMNRNTSRAGTDFAYTSQLIYTCNTGYEMTRQHQTTLTMTCQSNKQWSLAVPTCIKMLCPNPGTIRNTTRTTHPSSSSYEYLDTVTFTPHWGYEQKTGTKTRRCQSNRVYSGSAPTFDRVWCPTPTYIRNSTRTGADYQYLGQIRYTCDIGYEFKNGTAFRVCLATRWCNSGIMSCPGAWNGTLPYCGRVVCGDPGMHRNTTRVGSDYAYLSRITYRCDPGYEMNRQHQTVETMQCQSNKRWTKPVPVCIKMLCPNPNYFRNTTRTTHPSASSYEYLDTVTFTPHWGYEQLTGHKTRTCQSNRKYGGNAPTFDRVWCPTPAYIRNSTRAGADYQYLGQIRYTCDIGYEFKNGTAFRVCHAKRACNSGIMNCPGAWNGTLPYCGRVVCGDPGMNRNTTRVGTDFAYTSWLVFTCDVGYEMNRQHQTIERMQCQSNKKWSKPVPVCIKVLCPNPNYIRNTTRTTHPSSSFYEYLDTVTFTPHWGYEQKTGTKTRTCQATRVYNGNHPTFDRTWCPTPAYVRNSTRAGTDDQYLGIITYTCDIGYEFKNGTPTQVCHATNWCSTPYASCPGRWNGTTPYCGRVVCGDPGMRRNMTRHGTDFAYTSWLVYTCDVGYEMNLNNKTVERMQCQHNKQWSNPVPVCSKIHCPDPSYIRNTTRTTHPTPTTWEYLDWVTYTPHWGYEQKTGNKSRMCLASKLWHGLKPTFDRIWCPNPAYVSNSTMLGTDFQYLGVIKYVCDVGYEIKNGSQVRRCNATRSCNPPYTSCPGAWNGTLPMCGRVECFNLKNPRNGRPQYSFRGPNLNTVNYRWFYLDRVLWKCDPGFTKKSGDWEQVCQHTGQWNATTPVCLDKDECRSSPCQHSGICRNLVNKWQCSCVNGFSGRVCEIPPTVAPAMLSGSSPLVGGSHFNPPSNAFKSDARHVTPVGLLYVLSCVTLLFAR